MHGLIPRLTPFAIDTEGLGPTLESLVRDWQRRFPGVRIEVHHDVPADLGPSLSLAIYRIVQEGLITRCVTPRRRAWTSTSAPTASGSWSACATTASGCRPTGHAPATSA